MGQPLEPSSRSTFQVSSNLLVPIGELSARMSHGTVDWNYFDWKHEPMRRGAYPQRHSGSLYSSPWWNFTFRFRVFSGWLWRRSIAHIDALPPRYSRPSSRTVDASGVSADTRLARPCVASRCARLAQFSSDRWSCPPSSSIGPLSLIFEQPSTTK